MLMALVEISVTILSGNRVLCPIWSSHLYILEVLYSGGMIMGMKTLGNAFGLFHWYKLMGSKIGILA